MRKATVFFVTFYSPGIIVSKSETKNISSPSEKIEWPENAYAYTLHKRDDLIENGKTFRGEPEQIGFTIYHPDSKVESLAEVKKNPKATKLLISNMEINNWSNIVWSRWGNWPQPFNPDNDRVEGK